MSPACDIIVPVHDSVDRALDLLESLAGSTPVPYRVLLLDDASDPQAGEILRGAAAADARIELERWRENRGYVKTANHGLRRSTAPYVCLLNSDTLVTPGWLEKLVRCAESDPAIMVVNPLSNAAADLSVAMPPGFTPWMMAERLEEISERRYPDVVTAVGFCFFLKREAIDRFGVFDEAYGLGYGEESDFCMRVLAHGLRVVAADDAFVFHEGEGTFTDRERRYAENRPLFDARWRHLYEPLHAAFLERSPLQEVRDRLFEGLALAGHIRRSRPPRSLGLKAWRLAGHVLRGNHRLLLDRAREEVAAARRRLWKAARGSAVRATQAARGTHGSKGFLPEDQPLAYPTPAYRHTLPRSPSRLSIAFLVHDPQLSGGVIEIAQLVNRLVLEGHDAFVATLATQEMQHRLGLFSQPLVFPDEHTLLEQLPDVDVVVATHWRTAWSWAGPLRERRRVVAAYFVQGFEPDLYPPLLPEHRQALGSYGRVAHRIVTSAWLAERLAGHGFDSVQIPLGVNLGVFHPRGACDPARPFTVTAIARPDPEERSRGFAELLDSFASIHHEDPTIAFELFGCDLRAMPRRTGFPYRHLGVIAKPDDVARHLARCDILVDPSRCQAFGRPGLEAMACGVATVLPREGGIGEYARDGENTIAFSGGDAAAIARAVLALRRDGALRERLARAGLATARRFDHREEGRRHLALYRALLEHRP